MARAKEELGIDLMKDAIVESLKAKPGGMTEDELRASPHVRVAEARIEERKTFVTTVLFLLSNVRRDRQAECVHQLLEIHKEDHMGWFTPDLLAEVIGDVTGHPYPPGD
ncbi:MAG: hypothetical protein JO252_04235 [Planctomycetaceae bacterium]|nr:hypothetical protein [Planctomycetaceae bacterium]